MCNVFQKSAIFIRRIFVLKFIITFFLKYFQPHCAVVSWLGLVVKIMSNTRSEA